MKNTYLAFVCVASFAMATACGGAGSTENTEPANDTESATAQEQVASAVSDEEQYIAEADAVGITIDNNRIVIKYEGNELGFCDLPIKAPRQYLVIEGFKDDGNLDEWKGLCQTWYFFDDEASYDSAVKLYAERMGQNGIQRQNRKSLFFVGIGLKDRDWTVFKDIVADVEGKRIPGNTIDTEHPENYHLVRWMPFFSLNWTMTGALSVLPFFLLFHFFANKGVSAFCLFSFEVWVAYTPFFSNSVAIIC